MPVPLMDPHSQYAAVREQIARAIADVIDSGRFILGPRVGEAEKALAARVGAAHGIGVANGTDALVIALRALGVGPGDEVICPAFTFYATAESIAAVGAIPVFADIEDETYNLDPAAVEAAITPRTRAIVPVHLFGHPAAMGPLMALAKRARSRAPRGRRAGVRRGARRRALRLDRRRGDVLVLPHQNLPAFGDGGLITTGSTEVDRRVLRFHGSEDKGDIHARRLQLLERAAGGHPAGAAAVARRLGTTAASRWPPATPSSASASTSCCRRSPRALDTSTTSTSCAARSASASSCR